MQETDMSTHEAESVADPWMAICAMEWHSLFIGL